MLSFLKNHPFPVEAWFNNSTVLTFAVPKEQLEQLIPDELQLDTFQDQYGFIAVAMVQTSALRPKGFPAFMGNDFFLIGYRIFVRYTDERGKRLRGLYILKSETNKKRMEVLGSLFTRYKYNTTDIQTTSTANKKTIHSKQSNFNIQIDTSIESPGLPVHSPFSEWKVARRFAGPLPFTFSVNKEKGTILIIKGVRQNWKPQPIHVSDYSFEFLDQLELKGLVLANAFEIKEVPYHWESGKLEAIQALKSKHE